MVVRNSHGVVNRRPGTQVRRYSTVPPVSLTYRRSRPLYGLDGWKKGEGAQQAEHAGGRDALRGAEPVDPRADDDASVVSTDIIN